MKIVMTTNTYKPIIGGLERSVEILFDECRKRGHDVLIVTPEHKGAPADEKGVIRVPAIQNFNGTDFAIELPIHINLLKALDRFKPDIIHTHHPFLIGDTALRIAHQYRIPLMFTHHTLYEQYTHYVPLQAEALKRFVVNLATEYANLCDQVIAPSDSIASLLRRRGVRSAVDVVPTGIYTDTFKRGDGKRFREKCGIKDGNFVIGTVGRIAPEKNMDFLCRAVIAFLKENRQAEFLVVGSGSSLQDIQERFKHAGLSSRLHCVGALGGQQLIDAYRAMDVFVFASHSETQGLVVAEAMAASIPVIAVDAPGVREVVRDPVNGRLLASEDEERFREALQWYFSLSGQDRSSMRDAAADTARRFSVTDFVDKMIKIYERVLSRKQQQKTLHQNPWLQTMKLIEAEVALIKTFTKATSATLHGRDAEAHL